ncbi:HsdM family class I SAM-dependent methyltransferase [Stenotrophomonas maltophilia]|uniref:HsdM family class I SAM-dependent methyltransferase n=1 Tax=Stenotrophomonas maltophilia TaxID=40324 RepID=UPI000D67F9A0|nr:N-6 DNA methylase [Stenotrophomonas maltophilia]PWI01602.1 hypothetical protein DI494_15115 [Stenotrophomonas maltophilia]
MKTETECQNEFVTELAIHASALGRQYQDAAYKKHPALKAALAGGAKSIKKTGTGKPDGAIFSDLSLKKVIALVEVKPESKDGSTFLQAREEARAYVRHCASRGLHIPLAIAYDGQSLAVDFFCEASNGSFTPCLIANGQSFEQRFAESGAWPTGEELLVVSQSSDGQIRENISVLEEAFTRDFILKINDTMQVSSVPVIDRVVLFTAFLVACRSELFRNLLAAKALTVSQAGKQTLAGFDALIDTVEDDEVARGLRGFSDFIKPRLSARNGEDANGAVAIHRIILEDIPVVCAKHKLKPSDLLDRLNASMFNVVDVYEAFQAYAPDNDLGQYFTPRHIVRAMIRLVEQFRGKKLDENDVVYDPACGVGGFLVGALERVAESKHGQAKVDVKRAFGARLMGCEPAAEIIQVARINLWMHGDGTSGIYKESSLERDHLPSKSKGTKPGDHGLQNPTPASHPIFKAVGVLKGKGISDPKPSIVLMNPPFPTKKKTYHAFEFVEHALAQLREGGWLCAVVPATTVVVEDKSHTAFRKRLLKYGQLKAVVGMPADLFAPGASVNTYLLLVQRHDAGHQANQPVLFSRCPDDGFSMSKSTQRREGPRTVADKQNRRWSDDGDFGGNLSDLLHRSTVDGAVAPGWVKRHLDGGVDVPRHAISACLPKVDIEAGSEWAPEKFIHDEIDTAELLRLANRIYAEAQAYDLVKKVGGGW